MRKGFKKYYDFNRMNKSYINKCSPFYLNDCKIYTNRYSIVLMKYTTNDFLNENMGKQLVDFINNFDNWLQYKEVDYKSLKDSKFYNIDNDYSFSVDMIKNIYYLIHFNKMIILKNKNDYHKFICKMINTKNNECAYLLPCKKY